jgi:threonine/homoserine/homoserine lactone efflux protein
MLEPIVSGITFGLLLAVMLGPVFFTLLQTSLHEGFKAGVFLAAGVLLSDTLLICVCYFFASLIKMADAHKTVLGIVGGVLMIGFGAFNFFRKVKLKEVDDNKKTVHAHFALKGFALNLANPAVLFFWLGVVGLVNVKEDYTTTHEMVFFASVLGTVFGTDVLKSYVSNRIKNILKPSVMVWINRIIGIVLAGFGIHMILKVI